MNGERKGKRLLPFWPHYVLSEFIAWYLILGLLIILAAVFPAGLEDKANAFQTPTQLNSLAGTDAQGGLLTWGEKCKTVPIRLEHAGG